MMCGKGGGACVSTCSQRNHRGTGGIHLNKENIIRNSRWNASLRIISVTLRQCSSAGGLPPAVTASGGGGTPRGA